jgi:O-antigen ligase
MNVTSWRATVNSRTFALVELCIVAISGAALCLLPRIGIWAIAASLIPWGLRFTVGEPLFRRTRIDAWLAIFLFTAFVGAWASYDRFTATQKLYLIIEAVILYYALTSQPKENLVWVSAGFFGIGVGAAGYYFLTHDFIAAPRKVELVNMIGRWIMWVRPELGWRAIHPNYVAGLAAIMAPCGFYLLLQRGNYSVRSSLIKRLILSGLLLIVLTLMMTTSRGILMAILAATGVFLLWIGIKLSAVTFRQRNEAIFPPIVILYLLAVAILLYAGPAKSVSGVSEAGLYGSGSRAELFERSLYLVADFPLSGGGLASFPGLYSQYILDIPIYYLPNSHNMFLDVFIEQGIFGGAAFLTLYLIGIWRVSSNIATGSNPIGNLFNWVALASLIIAFVHGMVDDYLYQGNGAILSLALLGIVPDQFNTQPIFAGAHRFERGNIIALVSIGAIAAALIIVNQNTIRSIWYSNLGAVQMARIELAGFPTNQWAGPDIVQRLRDAEASLLASVEAAPSNRTANHRLGLIAMLRRDFAPAAAYLEKAYMQSSKHRGIVKSLGFSYAWNGDLELAQSLLAPIPESRNEFDSYVWYWTSQGLPELSSYALDMKHRMGLLPLRP